nr:protein kinase family protein [Anaerolineae bacterium]
MISRLQYTLLDEIIAQEGRLSEDEMLGWAQQLMDALAYCHEQGVIHRDVKPPPTVTPSSTTTPTARSTSRPPARWLIETPHEFDLPRWSIPASPTPTWVYMPPPTHTPSPTPTLTPTARPTLKPIRTESLQDPG